MSFQYSKWVIIEVAFFFLSSLKRLYMPALPMQTTLVEFDYYLSSVSTDISTLTVKVLDSNGRIARKISTNVSQGIHSIKTKLSDLSAGTYVLNAFSGDRFLKAIKFIK